MCWSPMIIAHLFACLVSGTSFPLSLGAAPGDVYVSTDDGAGSASVIKFRPDGTKSLFASDFQNPQGLAFDHAGNLIVAAVIGDSNPTGAILEIAPTGSQRLLASIGSAPRGLAYDIAGNLFVADSDCNCISRIAPDGTQTIYADGFDRPAGIAFDHSGNLFVSNGGTDIVKIMPNGDRITFAAGIGSPNGLAFNRFGFLFAAASDDNAIYGFAADGTRSTFSSGFPARPIALALDVDEQLLVSLDDGSIYKLTYDGIPSLFVSGLGSVPFLAIEPQPVGIEAIGNRGDGKVLLHGHAVINAVTRIQGSNTPDPTSFVTIQNAVCGPRGRFVIEDVSDKAPKIRFYRLVYP
jgi:DNA-binding beta-propeller fold protein YncE